MRNRVSLFEDQYKFYKVYKSKKLLCAFVEYMFEDVEPKNLSEKEQIIFESLRERMQKSKQISDWNSKGWQTSKRTKVVKNSEWNNRSELESSDKSKGKSTISQRVSQTPKKDNEVEDILSYDNILREKDINNLSNDKLDNEVVQYGDEGINNLCSKISEVYKKHWLTIDTSNRKYAGQRVRKWELVKAKKEWLDSHWYENVEQFVNDIISRAKTIKYWNWLSKISDLYGLWKHKDEILNQTHKAIEPWTLEHFNWFCENYVWKKTYHDIDGDKPYTKAMYFNYLMSEYWWDRPKARETRDKMLGR